ncbi:MAG: SPOR domain-containing protein [Legionellaceae bacterium]|nr:SPOR domain-containing protein [Legionellaceae bacterium]
MKKTSIAVVMIGAFSLSACMQYGGRYYSERSLYQGHTYGDYEERIDPEYGQYSDDQQRNMEEQRSSRVSVPDSYHVGSRHSPERHQSRDNSWIRSQNPQGYTIQLAEGAKASAVAAALTRAPKRDRMATLKSFENGQVYFRGLYGSYHRYDEAKQALEALPEDLRGQAQIKKWSSVQRHY